MGSHSKKAKFAVSLHAKHPSQAPEKLIQELGLKP
ncbi:MAG: hypothetical protein JWM53_3933, partial [bacterium]|nr:hypothetical protein [bacterium]